MHPTSRPLTVVLLACALALSPSLAGETDAPTPPYFTNVTDEMGLTGVEAFRVSVGDLNGDGYPDLFVHLEPTHSSGDVLDKQRLYMNELDESSGTRHFVDRTAGSGIGANREGSGEGRHSDAAIFADVDNDGDVDVFTNVYLHRSYDLDLGTNDLLLNDGDGTFTLSPTSTFHTQPNWNTPAATFLDYDNDGKIDLFIGTWYKPDSTLNFDRLYQGDGAGGFDETTTAAGLTAVTTCVYAVASFDWDDDGDLDLFAPPYSRTVLDSYARHWRNNGDGTFTQVQDTTNYDQDRGFPLLPVSFGTMPYDYDNDGDLDFLEIMTHGVGDGEGDIHTTAVTNDEGVFSWTYGKVSGRGDEDPDLTHHGDHFGSWLDVDGDMLSDFVLTESGYDNPRIYLFLQATDNTFSPDTPNSGFDEINVNGLSPGYATPADVDRDGDQDLVIIASQQLRVYRNDVGTDNHWIAIDLEGIGAPGYANKSGIGARVEVTAGGVTQTQEVHSGNGHEGPMRPFTLHFGLGANDTVDTIRVRWPNASLTTSELTNVAADQFLTIVEPCDAADDPAHLLMEKAGSDILMSWDEATQPDVTWNVYRELTPDPAGWGDAHERDITDEEPGTPRIQHTDVGALSGSETFFYLVTASNVCGETPLR